MPRMTAATSVAANSISANVLVGQPYQTLQYKSALRLAATTTAEGITSSWMIGERQVVNGQRVSASNREPDFTTSDLIEQSVGNVFQPMFLTFANSTAGALVVKWIVDVVRA